MTGSQSTPETTRRQAVAASDAGSEYPSADSRQWFLTGRVIDGGPPQIVPILSTPFRIGRRRDLALCLPRATVSGLHAEINMREGRLYVNDLGSRNGTFVNGQAIRSEIPLEAGDVLQLADVGLRIDFQIEDRDSNTMMESCCDQAIALSRFEELLNDRAMCGFLQRIVPAQDGGPMAFELLGRGRLFGLRSPEQMFRAAERLNRERELSVVLREEGLKGASQLPARIRLYVNTHPLELEHPQELIESLAAIRHRHPDRPFTVEVHEAAVISSVAARDLSRALSDLDMELAYDDFGAGQARLAILRDLTPSVLKFDIALIHGIHTAGPVRQRLLGNLVRMAHDVGISTLAEGVEVEDEAEVCRQIGFDLMQGFLFGKPCRVRDCLRHLEDAPESERRR